VLPQLFIQPFYEVYLKKTPSDLQKATLLEIYIEQYYMPVIVMAIRAGENMNLRTV
jgi:hypothetical protein